MAPEKCIYNSWAKSEAMHEDVHCYAFFPSFKWEPAMHTEGPVMLCNSISVHFAFKMFWVSWGPGKDNEREEGMQFKD